jgi:tetratricopeptide (TPR) repeat protein
MKPFLPVHLPLLFLLGGLIVPARAQDTDSSIVNDINTAKDLIETDVPAALDLANTAFINSRELGYDPGIAECYLVVGRCYIQTADYDLARKSLDVALKFAEKCENKALISDCYFYMGRACYITGNTDQQLSLYNKAYAMRQALNDQKRLADSYHAFGNMYLQLSKDSLAESYFQLARKIRLRLNDLRGLAAICNNLAIIAGNRHDTSLYRSLMFQAIRMNEQSGNMRYLATNHGNLGLAYLEEKNYDSAWYHCFEAYKIRRKNDFKDHLAGSYKNLGDILFAQRKFQEALTFYKQGAEVAERIMGREWMIANYSALSETYAKLDSQDQSKKYEAMASKLDKERQADTVFSKKIPLPPAFDFAEPEVRRSWPLWAGGGFVLLCLAGFTFYRMKK